MQHEGRRKKSSSTKKQGLGFKRVEHTEKLKCELRARETRTRMAGTCFPSRRLCVEESPSTITAQPEMERIGSNVSESGR